MARITVATEALTQGQFPPVCCKTGVHTDDYVRITFVETPGWTWILLPFGFIPFLIARLFVTTEFDGVLPMSPPFVRRMGRLRRVAQIAGVAGVGCLIAAMFVSTELAVLGFVLIGIAAACLIASTIMAPDAKRDVGRGAVEIKSVHRRFVETIEAAWAQSGITP
jgi:MFS family permease